MERREGGGARDRDKERAEKYIESGTSTKENEGRETDREGKRDKAKQ